MIFLVSDLEKVAGGMEEESDQHMVLQVLLQGNGSKSARRSSKGIENNAWVAMDFKCIPFLTS